MDGHVLLYNSTVCRLCGEENENGTLLYSSDENEQNLSDTVNAYLPIKVSDDGLLPRTICPGCTIQLEASVEFLDLIIKGQKTIRHLLQREKEYKKAQKAAPPAPEVITKNIIYEINTSDGVYQVEHPISLQIAGLDKPKRKRGRPPKKQKTPEELAKEEEDWLKAEAMQGKKEDEEPNGKRRRKTPSRFSEVVQGKELDKILVEEGVIDGEESESDSKEEPEAPVKPQTPKEPEVIGVMETSGEVIEVVVVKGKGRGRPKGRCKPTIQTCSICGMEFTCVGRYMSHIAQHGKVVYQCTQEDCHRTFTTRIVFTEHQQAEGHTGQNVIHCNDLDVKLKSEISSATIEKASEKGVTQTPKVEITITSDKSQGAPSSENSNKNETTPSTEEIGDEVESLEDSNADEANTAVVDVESPNTSTIIKKERPEAADSDVVEVPAQDPPQADDGKPMKLKCNFCDKMFNSRQSKSLHIKARHGGERPYVCGVCGAAFPYPRSLTLHAIRHRKHSRAAGYACDLCGKILNHPSSVVYHKEAEHAGHQYVCLKCGKSFKHKQLLQRHQLVHSQLRPFTCLTCNASFKTKANLLNHTLLHTGVKKYCCEVCKHRFAHKTSLTLHMRLHSGLKPFTCNTCGKSFSQKGNLSEHERIHTGEKPYVCAQCGRAFTTSSQRRLHAARHAADKGKSHVVKWAAREGGVPRAPRRHKTFKCALCSKSFSDCTTLNKHTKRVHKQVSLLNFKVLPLAPAPPSPAVVTVVTSQPPSPPSPREDEESVIYVTYGDGEGGEAAEIHILDPDQAAQLNPPKATSVGGGVYSGSSLLVDSQPAPVEYVDDRQISVTDEDGNPLHLTMQDGTRLAITSADGKSLQVVTHDGQTIPVEINGYQEEVSEDANTIVHQLNLQKTVEGSGNTPVAHYFTIG